MTDVTLPGLIVPVEARIDRLEKALKRASQTQTRFAKDMERRAKQNAERVAKQYDGLGTKITQSLANIQLPGLGIGAAGLAGAAGLGVVAGQVRESVRAIAELGNEARRAGVAAEDFQRWQYVADQNRISLDALTDGFKELSLRADEWIVTGQGPGAEAFTRLGFTADDLAKRLKNPSDLMLEIIGRLGQLDEAAQIRVADEVFGGTGGERFVEMLGRGEAEIRAMMGSASVLTEEQIAKADELDRRYTALTSAINKGWKFAALGAADFVRQILNIRLETDKLAASSLFRNPAQAPQLLGPEVAATLEANSDAAKANANEIANLLIMYEQFGAESDLLAPLLQRFSGELRRMGVNDASEALFQAAQGMQSLTGQMDAGEISASDFEGQMGELITKAREAFASLGDIDDARFGRVIERLGGLWDSLESLRKKAGETRAALPGGENAGVHALRERHEIEAASMGNWEAMRAANERFTTSEQARNAATSEALRLEREREAVRKRAAEAGATLTEAQVTDLAKASLAGDAARSAANRTGTSAGGRSQSEFERAVADLQREKAALDAEAASLLASASAGRDYGDAVEYARTRAELLVAAQREGRAVTPALTAEVDRLAQAHLAAGNAAKKAAADMKTVEERGKRGAEALSDVFMSVLDGSKSAEEALADLLMQIAKAQMQKALMGFFEGPLSGVSSAVGGLLGFASGGYTGHGGKYEPAGIVHRGEYVLSKAATARLGVGNLDALHSAALRGYASGGLVGRSTAPRVQGFAASAKTPAPSISINSPITVNASGGTPEQNADLARQVAQESEAMLRALVQREMVSQMRPGGLMAR
ncbi:hypothetical protein [Alloyangia pacifica]|uniref:hypothetical protein n=1 Tax=Alloyangia pacifica TaxID=311180 RepID=UPI001CD73A64|nr:hypothetical protein [Alloyangia pacifica]MCA0996311.1 hypothetical protein [Alloyangia pacifica]